MESLIEDIARRVSDAGSNFDLTNLPRADAASFVEHEAIRRQRKLERAIRGRKRRILIDQTTRDTEQLTVD